MRRINMNRASGCCSPSAVAPAVAVRSKRLAYCLTPPEGTYVLRTCAGVARELDA